MKHAVLWQQRLSTHTADADAGDDEAVHSDCNNDKHVADHDPDSESGVVTLGA